MTQAPKAKKVQHINHIHSHSIDDPYHWLRDETREDPEVLAYLEAENNHTSAVMSGQQALTDRLYQEITGRIIQEDESVPYQMGSFWYQTTYTKGQEYPRYVRRQGSLEAAEEVLIDLNELAKGHAYYSSNAQAISHDHQRYAFSEDTVSRRQYKLRFKDLKSGEMFADEIENTTGSVVWAKDNQTVFYTKKHPVTLLPYQVYRHTLGQPVTDDVLVYEELDDRFYLSCYESRSRDYVMIYSGSTTTTEVRYLASDQPQGEFTVVVPREENHEYSVEDHGGQWIILSNSGAQNFKVCAAPLGAAADQNNWTELVGHCDQTLIYDLACFKDWLVLEQRADGIRHLKAVAWRGDENYLVKAKESVYTMWVGHNPETGHNRLRYGYDSMGRPSAVYELDLDSRSQTLLKQNRVNGEFDASAYHSQRVEVKARDGALVPVSLVYKKGLGALIERPLLVYGYGSYGSSVDPRFSISRLSLLDRGFVYAIAHIRGSQARGRQWYEDGKLFKKMNTFHDFIDVTSGLLEKQLGDPDRVYAWGGSAGGLLMGAVANIAGHLYHGMIADVPFVDVINTMLDESIPLTTGEFDEWGNPKNQDAFEYMRSYSPYDQVQVQAYPNMLVTTGLHDSQVQYWEPAKWVAKLRDLKTDDNILLLRTNMDTGHGGASGRFAFHKETAQDYAFLLMLAGTEN